MHLQRDPGSPEPVICRLRSVAVAWLAVLLVAGLPRPGTAATALRGAYPDVALLGPEAAVGVVVYSHGRSLTAEDADSPSPAYLRDLALARWDTLRFDRPRQEDSLPVSAADLAARVHELHRQGYRRIVLAGQSFGGFLSLMAAGDAPDEVDSVVALAPAAFGSFVDSYDSWQLNASELYRQLERLHRTRVLLGLFHGDDYDPGGRGERARSILAARGLQFLVLDQPRDLVGHLAGASGLFVRRYGACLRRFLAGEPPTPAQCESGWGRWPGPEVAAPGAPIGTPATAPSAGSAGSASATDGNPAFGQWYGFYPNGREFILRIEAMEHGRVRGSYQVGSSVDGRTPATRDRRIGRIDGTTVVFDEPHRPVLRLSPSPSGDARLVWNAPDGARSMEAAARRLE